ncbi:hypothetical protein Pma05_71980 [Plantactinospora mayteni]|uniref:Uncharacterized protein n=1 Tax=Plantactinospora mayteni TaxID=566021 RepID=A0ABQ4F129_9ACTN|nr:hypothetical protein Pma05_71980 [Plantactinospora mayteni]
MVNRRLGHRTRVPRLGGQPNPAPGLNGVVLPGALQRIREHCLPLEFQRVQEATGQGSFVGKILIFEREAIPDRTAVILIREPIGF